MNTKALEKPVDFSTDLLIVRAKSEVRSSLQLRGAKEKKKKKKKGRGGGCGVVVRGSSELERIL